MDAPPTETATPPARPRLDPEQRRLGLILSIFEGLSAQAQTCLTGNGNAGPNAITVGFAFLLGAQDRELGLLAALPVFGNLLQYVSAALSRRIGARKPIVTVAATLSRVLWLGIGLLPFLLERSLALKVFLVLWFFTNGLISLSGNLWVSWMADLVPPRIRGSYFSRRTRATTFVLVVTPLLLSYVLSRWFGLVPQADLADAAVRALQAKGFALAFGASAVFGVICCILLVKQPEPLREPHGPAPAGWFLAPVLDKTFWPFLAFNAVFWAANGLSSPFWTPFQLKTLGLPYEYVNGWFVIVQGTCMVVSLKLWGRISDRFGNRPVIALALCLISSHPWYYIFATGGRSWLIFFDAASSGLAWAGYNLAVFNLVLALAPREKRELYWATQAVVIGVSQATFSVLAGSYVSSLPETLPFLGRSLDRYQQIFLSTGVARLACLGFFLGAVYEPRRAPIRTFVVAVQGFVKARLNVRFMAHDD